MRRYLKLTGPDRSTFGVPPLPGYEPEQALSSADGIDYSSEWVYHGIPSDSQGDLGACVGYAWANWYESMLRKYVGRDVLAAGEQIDGEAIWREGRRTFYPDEPVEAGGMLLEHGFCAALDMEILPPGSELVKLKSNSITAIGYALKRNPLVIAQATHGNWQLPNNENGLIANRRGDVYAGHALMLIGITKQAGVPFVLVQNSWGIDWAWHGIGMMSEPHYQGNTMDAPHFAVLPPGWELHQGWRSYIKRRPETAV